MRYVDILDKWAKYTDYNPQQKSFNLANLSYELHQVNKRIEHIINTYDNTGALAVIQAKIMFKRMLQSGSYNALEYMKNPNIVKDDKEIWNMFHCEEVIEAEDNYVNAINQLSDKIINKPLIGERNNEDVLNDLFEATDIVMASLDKCNIDLFARGGKVLPITKISTHIHLFETLAECLTALEHTDDGLYLCYINCGGTADGYFGFFLKNNGNLLSINERIDEAYSGQHSHSRNGRWAESKKYELFPYNYIFNYTEHDYKGYANKHLINEEKLAFFELGANVYLPIVISMIMISKQYVGKELDFNINELKYVDSLFSCNINKLSETNNQLMIVNNSIIVNNHNSVDLTFDLEKVMNGNYATEFHYGNDKYYKETGTFTNSNQLFVDLWGEGFAYDSSKIYETNSILRIGNSESTDSIPPEFVGTKQRMRLQGYYQIRKQLADYIRDKIHEEWINFGRTDAVEQWYFKCIQNNMKEIEKIIVKKYIDIQNGEKVLSDGWRSSDKNAIDIYFVEQKHPEGWGNHIFNDEKEKYSNEYYCTKTGAICSLFFTIKPKNWKQVEMLCGCEVPKIVKGWNYDGHFGEGNSILSATDLVSEVGTPFERYEINKYKELYKEDRMSEFNFSFSIGYSKRGLKQILNK